MASLKNVIAISVFIALPLPPIHALENGLARTPPLGWNSWNAFDCNIDETKIKGVADSMVSRGLKAAGYEYLVIDDCWEGSARDAQGALTAGPNFPSGIKNLADYVHAKGLKFGIYSSAGDKTCSGYLGSNGHEDMDAKTFAAWGVDFLKYDGCGSGDYHTSHIAMRDAIKKYGRTTLLSTAFGSPPLQSADTISNMARHTRDIEGKWDNILSLIEQSVDAVYFTKPGFWVDPDMLALGVTNHGTLSDIEAKSHFSMWCVLAAPLLIGTDLRSMTAATQAILTNPEALAIDQDSLGISGQRVWNGSPGQIWSRVLKDDGRAVVFLNDSSTEVQMTVTARQLGWAPDRKAAIRDVWEHADRGQFTGSYTVKVGPHACAFVRLTPDPDPTLPKVQYVLADEKYPNLVRVYFDRRVDRASAENLGNYAINGGVTIASAKLDSQKVQANLFLWPEFRMVELRTSTLAKGTPYVLTVRNVKDRTPAGHVAAASDYGFSLQARLTGTATGTCPSADEQPGKVFDGDTSTYVNHCSAIGLDFGTAKKIKALTFWERDIIYIDDWAQSIMGVQVQGSDDGTHWTTLTTIRKGMDFDTAKSIGEDWRRVCLPAVTLFISPDEPAYKQVRLRSNAFDLQELAVYEDKSMTVGLRPADPEEPEGKAGAPGFTIRQGLAGAIEVAVDAEGAFQVQLAGLDGRVVASRAGNGRQVVRMPWTKGSGAGILRLKTARATLARVIAAP